MGLLVTLPPPRERNNVDSDAMRNDGVEQPADDSAHRGNSTAPVLDVLGDHENAGGEDEGAHAPPPPTGESFGVSAPVRPAGLSRRTLAIASATGLGFLFVLIVGIAFAISSKATEAHALKMGDLTQKKPFIGQTGGGLAPQQAFATPVPNGTPTPYSPLSVGGRGSQGNPYATPTPAQDGGRVCQVQPGYAGPAQPGCPNQQRTPNGTQEQQQQQGGSGQSQSTPTPEEIAAQHDRDDQVAYVEHEANASAFVSDTGSGGAAGNDPSQSQGGAAGGGEDTRFASNMRTNTAQQNAPATAPAGSAVSTPAPTPPPPNYLNVGVGTWIPVTTKGNIDCSAPGGGGVTVQVRELVPDVSGTYPLIPPYSTLVGQIVPVSGGHCDIVWTLLRLPNGNEMSLRSYHTQDSSGEGGIGGVIDDHRWSIARTGLYAAGIASAAGYVLARATQPSSSNVVVVTQTSPTQQAITAAVGPIQSASDRIINMDANKPVKVWLPDGTHLNVYVDSPIYLPVWQGVTP